MSTQPFDYAAILADLEEKKSAIEAAIATLRSARAMGALGQSSEAGGVIASVSASLVGGEVPDGAFLGKSIPEAAKLYLEIVKKKQTARQIAEALKRGGMESTSKNWLTIVHAALARSRKSGTVVKIGSQWGLPGWYPKGIASAAPDRPNKKKAKQKGNRSAGNKKVVLKAAATEIKTTPQPIPITDKKKGGAVERISQVLQSKPGGEFTAQQIAEQTSLNVQVAYMMLARLAKQGKANKTPSGAYRAIGAKAVHAVM